MYRNQFENYDLKLNPSFRKALLAKAARSWDQCYVHANTMDEFSINMNYRHMRSVNPLRNRWVSYLVLSTMETRKNHSQQATFIKVSLNSEDWESLKTLLNSIWPIQQERSANFYSHLIELTDERHRLMTSGKASLENNFLSISKLNWSLLSWIFREWKGQMLSEVQINKLTNTKGVRDSERYLLVAWTLNFSILSLSLKRNTFESYLSRICDHFSSGTM